MNEPLWREEARIVRDDTVDVGRDHPLEVLARVDCPGEDRGAVERAHATSAAVLAWTVDTREDLERVVAAGVDGVITNDPRLFSP